MVDNLKIIDNFLLTGEFLKIKDIVLSEKFPWFYIEHVSLEPKYNMIRDPLAVETSGLNHVVYDRNWNVKSFTYQYFSGFIKKLEELGFKEENIIRLRLSMKNPKIGFTAENYNLPHVDYYYPHETMILYLNNTDGDTRVFDQWFTPTSNNNGIGHEVFTTQTRITPKENRLLWINGLQYHTAANPLEHSRRVILNINLDPR